MYHINKDIIQTFLHLLHQQLPLWGGLNMVGFSGSKFFFSVFCCIKKWKIQLKNSNFIFWDLLKCISYTKLFRYYRNTANHSRYPEKLMIYTHFLKKSLGNVYPGFSSCKSKHSLHLCEWSARKKQKTDPHAAQKYCIFLF